MNGNILLFACAAALVSCDKGPQVKLENATGSQVANAVTDSGTMSGGSFLEPGEWQTRMKVVQMDIPGMSPDLAARMKQAFNTDPTNRCVTPAEVKKPTADFFGANKSCTYDHFTMGAGRIDIAMTCHREGETQTMTAVGSYTPTTYSTETEARTTGGRHSGSVTKFHIDSQRVGECTGKDDD